MWLQSVHYRSDEKKSKTLSYKEIEVKSIDQTLPISRVDCTYNMNPNLYLNKHILAVTLKFNMCKRKAGSRDYR